MKVDALPLDGLSQQTQSVGRIVEVLSANGILPDLFRGQRLAATVLARNDAQVLINLQGTQVALPASAGLTPGTEILFRVASVVPQLTLEVLPASVHSQAQLPPLSLGQSVSVDILDHLPNGHVRVDLQGTLLEATFTEELPTSTPVQATVKQLLPQLVLQLQAASEDPAHTEAVHLLRNAIAHHTLAGESLETLLPTLTALTSTSPHDELPASAVKLLNLIRSLVPDTGPPTAERLAAFVRDGGLLYEAKLQQETAHPTAGFSQVAENDVKGLLLQLTRDLDKARTTPHSAMTGSQRIGTEESALASILRNPQHQELQRTLTAHLEHIESQQAVNVLAREQGEPYQLQIPFFTGQEMTTAFLAINPERHGQEDATERGTSSADHGYHILFLLDLERLGQTRIEARIGSKSIWGAFYVEHAESVAEIQAELPNFRTTLQALGYDEVLLIAKPLEQLSPEKRQKFDALAGGVPASIHLLDVKA